LRVEISGRIYSAEFFAGRPRLPSTPDLRAISLICSRGKRGYGRVHLLTEDEFCHIGFAQQEFNCSHTEVRDLSPPIGSPGVTRLI
jgi:hypothetical protein